MMLNVFKNSILFKATLVYPSIPNTVPDTLNLSAFMGIDNGMEEKHCHTINWHKVKSLHLPDARFPFSNRM